MKHFTKFVVVCWLMFVVGCATPYHNLSSMNYLEQGAVRVAAQLYDSGQISDEAWQRVVVADEAFGQAWTEAVKLNRDFPDTQLAKEKKAEANRKAAEIADMVARWETE